MEISERMFGEARAVSPRSMAESILLHALMLALLMFVGARMVLHSVPPEKKELDIVFYRPPKVPLAARPAPLSPTPGPAAGGTHRGAPESAVKPKPNAPAGPSGPGKPELPKGPDQGYAAETKPSAPRANVGHAGILAFKNQFASLAQDKAAPRLGAKARYGAADNVGRASSSSLLTSNAPGSSGGINVASLSHGVGGGGRGGGGGGGGRGRGGGGAGGLHGVGVARAVSPIDAIGGGGGRPKAHKGAGNYRTDEEIQIVFDRYKASFYRLYNRQLRNDPTLQGQMIVRLTIEPDGSVSMCKLQSSDMNAPVLAAQVVRRVLQMNFGAKKDVQRVTISYPIDFLPAA